LGWGLGPKPPTPKPQIPNPQSPIPKKKLEVKIFNLIK